MYPTRELAQSPLFQSHSEGLPLEDRVRLTYERAKAIGKAYAFTPQDVLKLSPKFWKLHTDPICTIDGAAATLATLQYNCCAGTLAMFVSKQPKLADTLEDVLNFRVSGQFCLTEVGHGLDAFHLETTATLLSNGEFELNTPHDRAAKYMPPTAPVGIPCIAVVFARTIIDGEDRGIKPFIVSLHDGTNMNAGVVCKLLSQRGGSRPVNHSLTYFRGVRLPYYSLLGSPKAPADPRADFFYNISRVAVGTIAIGSLAVPALQVSSYIASRYSLRRTVVDNKGQKKPIMSFQTQKIPVLTTLAQSFVMQALHAAIVPAFCDITQDFRVRHAMASILKVTAVSQFLASSLTLGDRCGAQGLFEVNQLTAMHADIRGTSIAEGDLLVISIRLATELLLGRYTIPSTADSSSLLAKHETGLFVELRALLSGMDHHRSSNFDQYILPECLNLILAIGHRMAYDAATLAGVDKCLVDLYVTDCIKHDAAWYVENAGLSRAEQRDMERRCIEAVFPRLEEFLAKMELEPYITAPLVSAERWEEYLGTLTTFGDAKDRGEKHPVYESSNYVPLATVHSTGDY